MIRKAISVVLTLAAVACAALFIDGQLTRNNVVRTWFSREVLPGRERLPIRSYSGTFEFSYGDEFPPNDMLPLPDFYYLGLSRGTQRMGTVTRVTYHVPIWIPFILFAAYPSVVFTRGPLRPWRRRRRGRCLKCGYDLTGNESGVCPECGSEVSS